MSLRNDGTQVACLDLRGSSSRPENVNSFIDLATQLDERFRAQVNRSQGSIQPWSLVIIDTPRNLQESVNFYLMLATSPFNFKILVLLVLEDGDDRQSSVSSVRFLDIGFSVQQQVKFIFLTDLRGVEWAAGTHLPTAISFWEYDVHGLLNLGVLTDALREEVVFKEVFSGLQSQDVPAWAVGTQQIWMGKLSSELTKDAFVEVANDFISGNLSHQEPASIVPVPLFQGGAVIDGVLDPEQRLAKLRIETMKSSKLLREKFGIQTRRGILRRLSGTSNVQNSQIELHKGYVRELSTSVSNLAQSIDATNGLDWEEIRALRSSGVNLQEVERLLSGSTLENSFIDQITNFTQSSVGLSHSISQIREALFQLSEKVKTRDRQTTLDEVNSAVAKVTDALSLVDQYQKQDPKGFLFRAGRNIARLLRLGWPRIVFGALYIWTLSAGLAEIVSDGEYGFIPWPSPIRDVLHLTAVMLCVVLTLLGVLAGILLLHADQLVKQWGLKFELDNLSSKVDSMLDSLVSVAVNDWACYRTRTRIHRILVSLDNVLARVAETVNDEFVTPFESEDPDMAPKERPNPRVRRDLNDQAQGKAFMYIDDIKRIIHVDLSVMIGEALQSIYALKTVAGGELVPLKVQENLSFSLDRYVRDAKNFGLLYEDLSSAESAVAKRRALARRIWEEPSLVDEALKTVVLARSPVKLVTFVSPEDLLLLAADVPESREIRFVPSHASRRLLEVQNQVGFHPNVVHVEGMSAAGVVRISPLRSGGILVD